MIIVNKNKIKEILAILLITLIIWLVVLLLFIADKLTVPIIFCCLFVSFSIVIILSIALIGSYRFNKMAQVSACAQVI